MAEPRLPGERPGQEVDPQPDTVEARPERLVYVFGAVEGSEDRPTEVTFELEPDETGLLGGRVGLDGGASVPGPPALL